MTEEQIAKVSAFMQFERKYYEHLGVGLGLRLVQRIARIYGGNLSIFSIYNRGTTVHLELPIA
jgi:signal transduction histidine kinase